MQELPSRLRGRLRRLLAGQFFVQHRDERFHLIFGQVIGHRLVQAVLAGHVHVRRGFDLVLSTTVRAARRRVHTLGVLTVDDQVVAVPGVDIQQELLTVRRQLRIRKGSVDRVGCAVVVEHRERGRFIDLLVRHDLHGRAVGQRHAAVDDLHDVTAGQGRLIHRIAGQLQVAVDHERAHGLAAGLIAHFQPVTYGQVGGGNGGCRTGRCAYGTLRHHHRT